MSFCSRKNDFDVVILGTGLGATVLALILVRQGFDVLLIEKKSHPRFSIGESSIPETSLYIRILAQRFNTPELLDIASFQSIDGCINHNFGVKLNFGFVFSERGKHYFPGFGCQLGAITGKYAETHLFRQDIDAWMLQTVISTGGCVYQNTEIDDVQLSDREVRIKLEGHTDITAQYFVDASGYHLFLSKKYRLRDTGRLQTSSRSIFTHMIDVRHFEDVLSVSEPEGCSDWSKGTLHHLFSDGWLWVIPFNNHPEARNRLCSVGLMFNGRKHRETISDPEGFFTQHIESYPDLKQQFARARSIREWVSTPTFQHVASCSTGARWCLLSHAFGFVDPLFSRGLFNTVSVINQLVVRLVPALSQNSGGDLNFKELDQWQQQTLFWNDLLVAGAYLSFSNPTLWNWWFRVWAVVATWGGVHLLKVYQLLMKDPNDS